MTSEQQWKDACLLYLRAFLALRWAIYDSHPTIQRDSLILTATAVAASLIARVPDEIRAELGRMDREDKSAKSQDSS